MILSVLLSVVLYGHTLAGLDRCAGFCERIDCPPSGRLRDSCVNGIIRQHGSACGCCDTCIIQLDIDEQCGEDVSRPGSFVTAVECKEGLFCNSREICQQLCSTINQQVQDRLNSGNGQFAVGYTAPRCSDDGLFGPVQCSGSVCFCTDTEGNRLYRPGEGWLYQTGIWNSRNMNCECARAEAAAGESVGDCSPNGNYALGPGQYWTF